jgi:tetratricopeptide (TPR) repeat protein
LGLALMANNDWNEAQKQFEKAINIKTDYYAAKMNLAKCLQNQNRFNEAFNIYKNLQKKYPKNVNLLMSLAHINFLEKDIKKSESFLNMVLQLDKNNAIAYNNRAIIHMIGANFNKAISDLRKALSINTNFADAQNNFGVCYSMLGSYRKALKHYLTSIAINPNCGDAVQNAVVCLQKLNRIQDSITLLENYLDRNRLDISVRELLAKSFLIMKRYRLSSQQLNIAFNLAKKKYIDAGLYYNFAHFYNNFGVINHQQGDLDKAKNFYLKAKEETDTPSQIIYQNLIKLYLDINDLNNAKYTIKEALKFFADSSQILFLYSRYFFEIKNINETINCLNKIIEKEPTYINAYAFLSFIYSEIHSNYDLATEIISKGLNINKKNHALLNNLAYNYLLMNNINQARIILDSIRGAESNIFLTATRGLLLLKENNVQEGTSLYNRAIHLAQQNPKFRELVEQKKHLELVRFYNSKGLKEDAVKYLKRLLNSKLKSSIYYEQGEYLQKYII